MKQIPESRKVPDLTFFVSAALSHRKPLFSDGTCAQVIVDSLQHLRTANEVELYGFVVMPDHIHLIIKPLSPHTLPVVMRRFKSWTAHVLARGSIWDKGYFSKIIVDEKMIRAALQYVHENPVVAGIVPEATDYPWSSAADYYQSDHRTLVDSY